MNIESLVLKKVLTNPEEGLSVWPKLKVVYFTSTYSSIYAGITRYYNKYNKLPNFEDLRLQIRDVGLKGSITSLELSEDVDVDILTCVDALINQYTQNEALIKLDKFVDTVNIMSCDEIKDSLNDIVLYLDEKTHSSEEIFYMSDLLLLDEKEILSKVPLGISNVFDEHSGGVSLSELIMIGGYRGSGKSVVSANIACSQYLEGNTGIVFSIEMRAREVFSRMLSILSEVDNNKVRKNLCSVDDLRKIARVRADMFEEGRELYDKYISDDISYSEFEKLLLKSKRLKTDNQLVIVDNQRLTLADIDLNLQKFKSMYGDKLKVVVVDYINQIEIENMYSWDSQITLSKGLKNLARKYDVVVVAPYQISDKGEVRYSKGILDAADLSLKLEPTDKNSIKFSTTKARNISPINFSTYIDWNTLRIDPTISTAEDDPKSTDIEKKKEDKSEEDLPW